MLVFPAGRPVKIEGRLECRGHVSLWGDPRPDMPGSQPPELYQIRQYQDGDSMRDIHWKLSAKMDQMMSRQFAAETQCTATVYLDFQKAVMRTSAVWMLSVSWPPQCCTDFWMQDTSIGCAGMIWRKKSGEEKIIRNEEDYRGMLKELILCASVFRGDRRNPKEMPEIYQF